MGGDIVLGLIDVGGFGEFKEIEPIVVVGDSFQENGFDSLITDKVGALVKYDVINSNYNMRKLLNDLGIQTDGSNMYCPFHPDEDTGKASAKYHPDTDLVFCFSENKVYSSFHAIKLLYNIDTDKVFNDIWSKMGKEEKLAVLSKYEGSESSSSLSKVVRSEWDEYRDNVLSMFKMGKVTYTQYKNALYKVFLILNKDKESEVAGDVK